MNVNEDTVKSLGSFLIERQEADIVAYPRKKNERDGRRSAADVL